MQGGYVETKEKTATDILENCIYHNRETRTATADSIVYKVPAPHLHIQNKYSMQSKIKTKMIAKQLEQINDCPLLWVQLGLVEDDYDPPTYRNDIVKKAWVEKRLAFIDGSGCCNPMLIDLLVLLKLHLKNSQ